MAGFYVVDRYQRIGHRVVDCRWGVSGATNALKHAERFRAVARPPTVDGIHRTSEKE